jgi:hypothetical protein
MPDPHHLLDLLIALHLFKYGPTFETHYGSYEKPARNKVDLLVKTPLIKEAQHVIPFHEDQPDTKELDGNVRTKWQFWWASFLLFNLLERGNI